MDPSRLEAACQTGLSRMNIKHMARLAFEEVQKDPQKLDTIENDLDKLIASNTISDTIPKQQPQPQQQRHRYVPKAAWAMPHSAHVASSKAVLSALRSPTGEVDADLMEQALQAGWTREQILKAVQAAKPKPKTTTQS